MKIFEWTEARFEWNRLPNKHMLDYLEGNGDDPLNHFFLEHHLGNYFTMHKGGRRGDTALFSVVNFLVESLEIELSPFTPHDF